eukprot:1557874-Rhodomonas_salina.2
MLLLGFDFFDDVDYNCIYLFEFQAFVQIGIGWPKCFTASWNLPAIGSAKPTVHYPDDYRDVPMLRLLKHQHDQGFVPKENRDSDLVSAWYKCSWSTGVVCTSCLINTTIHTTTNCSIIFIIISSLTGTQCGIEKEYHCPVGEASQLKQRCIFGAGFAVNACHLYFIRD